MDQMKEKSIARARVRMRASQIKAVMPTEEMISKYSFIMKAKKKVKLTSII